MANEITQVITVVAVHGEGDRTTVNKLKKDLNTIIASDAAKARQAIDPKLLAEPDEPADVTVVARDDAHNTRIELYMTDWKEVDAFKALAGYDQAKRHWVHGGKIRVTVSAA